MRWRIIRSKAKQQEVMEGEKQRQSAVDHASPSTTTISNDDDHLNASKTSFTSLPADLFLNILQLAISVESDFSPTYNIRSLHVLNATCRHWRWTVLNSPSFWAFIPSYLPLDVFQTFLRRSGDALLHVDLVYDTYFGPQTNVTKVGPPTPEARFIAKLDRILLLRHRIRYLSLTLSTSALTSTTLATHLADAATTWTPILEGFRFRQTEFWRPSEEQRMVDAEVYVFTKFRSSCLREIYLDGVVIPRDYYTVKSLTNLSVPLTSANLVFKELDSTLCGCVHLVFLSLDLLKVRTFPAKIKASIPLPKLRHLSMKGNSFILSLVYGSLDVPLLEKVNLETGYSHSDPIAHFLPPRPEGCLHIAVDEPHIRLSFSEPKHFSLSLTSPFVKGSALSNYNILNRLLGSHRYDQITSLEFSSSSHFDLTFLPRFLSHFPALLILCVAFVDRKSSEGKSSEGPEPSIFLVKDAIDVDLLRSPTSPLRSLRSLVFRNLTVVLPQSSAFLLELSNAIEWRRVRPELAPLVVRFDECQGVTDALLEVCGLKFE
ncbi:hypothetical protein SCHPADRAFT_704600 [Schizopora paradoxa]|uniref:F-box domain-containing protein n=1 Tax=Schizopora paradoxa TaxID=27342 RepID=A0A0H2RMD6_9AGAM|nr:hypothetical protein SCHPADRAFT_704600 [Schizopora paradoxa]